MQHPQNFANLPPRPPFNHNQYGKLYLPDRFRGGNTTGGTNLPALPAGAFPIPPVAGNIAPPPPVLFPLPTILGNPHIRPNVYFNRITNVRAIQLSGAFLLRTNSNSRTKIPEAVENMPQHNPNLPGAQFPRLERLFRSNALWNNLKEYGRMDIPPPGGQLNFWKTTTGGPNLPTCIPLAPPDQQVAAIHGLWAWHLSRCSRPTSIEVESEPAVQDEVNKQFLVPLQFLLHTRYPAQIRQYLFTHQANFWRQMGQNNHAHGAAQNGLGVFQELQNDNPTGSYPRWGRTTYQGNLARAQLGRSSAGYSDYCLYVGGNTDCIAAVFEVKTWWTYPSDALCILAGPVNGQRHPNFPRARPAFHPGNHNHFVWGNRDVGAHVVKQIWAEMVFYKSRYAAWTNGQHIIIFVRTDVNELVMTMHDYNNRHGWDDADVLEALFGMACASIDTKFIQDNGLANFLAGQKF